jgi:hypothetical protein
MDLLKNKFVSKFAEELRRKDFDLKERCRQKDYNCTKQEHIDAALWAMDNDAHRDRVITFVAEPKIADERSKFFFP